MNKMSNQKKAQRIRKKLKRVNTKRLRLSVYRSSRNISAQIIDDKNHKTLVSASSVKKNNDKNKKSNLSIQIAELLAKKALEKNITKVYFDRGCYKFHGRIKLLTDTLRKNGLEF